MSDEQQQPGALSVGLFVLSLFVAVGIQSVLPGALAGAGVGAPDLVLVLVLVAALLTDAGTGALIGFAGGLLTAAVVGETVGTFLVTRSVAAFAAGSLAGRFFRTNGAVVVLAVVAGSSVAEALYGLAAPPLKAVTLAGYLRNAGFSVLWNAALALPAAWLLRRFGWGEGRR